jgi:hypothetical protein
MLLASLPGPPSTHTTAALTTTQTMASHTHVRPAYGQPPGSAAATRTWAPTGSDTPSTGSDMPSTGGDMPPAAAGAGPGLGLGPRPCC